MPEPIEGAIPDSPPGDPGKGVEPGGTPPPADAPPGDKPPVSDPGAGAGEVPDFVEKDGIKYYKGFDAHPEWRTLKDTKDALSGILEENDYLNLEDLVSDLKTGQSLASLIGTADANRVQALMDKAQKWDAAEEYWAEQESAKREKGETQEETIARLKQEMQAEKDARRAEIEGFQSKETTAAKLANFNKDVGDLVDLTESLSDAEKSVLKLHLGVNNPMDGVDIGDRKTVRAVAKDVITNYTGFIKSVKQAAIDDYVKGQSKITPTPQPAGDQTPTVTKKTVEVKQGMSDEEAFDQANDFLTETLQKMWQSQT